MTIKGIEHIGLTVPDIQAAEQFFINALDASVLYRIVPSDAPEKAIDGNSMTPVNGFPPEMKVTGLSMLRLGNGCNVELFQLQPEVSARADSIGQPGINHFSVYVDDIQLAGEKMKRHGAQMFAGPNDCFAQEAGKGNQTWFCRTPFGVLIELITLPDAIRYDAGATATRWLPQA